MIVNHLTCNFCRAQIIFHHTNGYDGFGYSDAGLKITETDGYCPGTRMPQCEFHLCRMCRPKLMEALLNGPEKKESEPHV
jgi:hypothetical protein